MLMSNLNKCITLFYKNRTQIPFNWIYLLLKRISKEECVTDDQTKALSNLM